MATTVTAITQRGWQWTGSAWTTETLPAVTFGYTEAELDPAVRVLPGLEELPLGIDPGQWQWVDLDGEGLTGLLMERADCWFYKRSLGEDGLGPARRVPEASSR